MIIFEYISHFLSAWFTAQTPIQATLEAIIFIVGVYGICKLLLFLIRYYILYSILKKIFNKFQGIKFKDSKYKPPPSNKEDEKLRSEKKEREAERVEVERVNQEAVQNLDMKVSIIMPEVGTWRWKVIKDKLPILNKVAQQMSKNGSSNFWQTFLDIQRNSNASSTTKEFNRW